MAPYYTIIITTFVLGAMIGEARRMTQRSVGPQSALAGTYTFLLCCAAVAFFALPVGFRYGVGADFWRYTANYYTTYRELSTQLFPFGEPGIRLLTVVAANLRDDATTFFLFVALLTTTPVVATLYRLSPAVPISFYLFITTLAWQESFNATRQSIAAAFIFYGLRFVLERRLGAYAVTVALASLFHISASVLILAYWIPRRRLSIGPLILLGLSAVGFLGSYHLLSPLLDQEILVSDYFAERVHPLRTALAFVPALTYWLFVRMRTARAETHFFANLMIFHALASVAAMNSAYVSRFLLYSGFLVCLALVSILRDVGDESRAFLTVMLCAVYGMSWYVATHDNYYLVPFVLRLSVGN